MDHVWEIFKLLVYFNHFITRYIAKKGECEGFEDASKCGVGSSLRVEGTVVESPAKGQAIEVKALKIRVLGLADAASYPLAKKKHSLEFLRDIAHLRPRTNTV